MKRSDADRERWVKARYGDDTLNRYLDGMSKPSVLDRRREGEHVLHAWRRIVDRAMDAE